MNRVLKQTIFDFYRYPPVGADDWRYLYQTAQVRVLEMQLLTRASLLDVANAADFEQALDLLGSTEYALPQGAKAFAELENILKQRRSAVRGLFSELMIDKPIVRLFKSRDDFANLRLATRRTLTKKKLGEDYSNDGNIAVGQLREMLEQGSFNLLPDYMRDGVEGAILTYYQDKDIRSVDYALDLVQAKYNLQVAGRLRNVFLASLFRIQIDLTNIRTMFRLKFSQLQLGRGNVFLPGGYVDIDRLGSGLEGGYEGMGQCFFATPYYEIVESGASYFEANKSFLELERACDDYLAGFLKTTLQVTTGPQPIIAYLLTKENEIRIVRLILTAKKNFLDAKLLLDRIP